MRQRVRVLTVDGFLSDTLQIEGALGGAGFDAAVTSVESEADFRVALEDGKWDLVIADYSLACFEGRAASREFGAPAEPPAAKAARAERRARLFDSCPIALFELDLVTLDVWRRIRAITKSGVDERLRRSSRQLLGCVQIASCNRAAAELLGARHPMDLETTLDQLLDATSAELARAFVHMLDRGEASCTVELELTTLTGRVLPTLCSLRRGDGPDPLASCVLSVVELSSVGERTRSLVAPPLDAQETGTRAPA